MEADCISRFRCDASTSVVLVLAELRLHFYGRHYLSIDLPKLKRLSSALLIGLLIASATAFGRQDTFNAPRTAIAAPAAEALSPRERVDAFEDVWETINEKYYDPSFNGVNWRAVRERYRPLIERAG